MYFLSLLRDDPSQYVIWVIVIMFSICFHEYAHAYIALKQGDSTAAIRGHLTLNPMVQMGKISIIMLLLIGISWGAVPVNPARMRHKYSHALVAFAGPVANLLLFFLFCVLFSLFGNSSLVTYQQMFIMGSTMNVVLFLFNMLPIPMLDGWTVFSFLFPQLGEVNDEIKNGLVFIIFILFFTTDLFNVFFVIGNTLTLFLIQLLGTLL